MELRRSQEDDYAAQEPRRPCQLPKSQRATRLLPFSWPGRPHIIGFCKGFEKVMQSTQSSCDETLGLIRNGSQVLWQYFLDGFGRSNGNEDSSRRFQAEVASALAAEAQG